MKELVLSKDYVIPTEGEIVDQAQEIASQVEEGWADPIKVYGALIALEKLISAAKDKVKPLAISEAEKYEKGSFSHGGATFLLKNLPANKEDIFGWSDKWHKAKERVDKAKDNLKDTEDKLKKELKKEGLVLPTGGATIQVTLRK